MAATLTTLQTQIIGTAIAEILSGELSDETINAIDSLKRENVPPPLDHLVAWIQGMNMAPDMRQSMITDLMGEIAQIAQTEKEARTGPPSNAWAGMNYFLFEILEDKRADLTHEDVALLPDRDEVPGWAVSLIDYAQGTSSEGKELTLGLLNILEDIIKKRKEELSS
ncbi:MAG TPA: hypothetical protein VJM08_07640 [Anaerolineales bacterium]|nr:hypothetical protein [Anaerolineales bacterium]